MQSYIDLYFHSKILNFINLSLGLLRLVLKIDWGHALEVGESVVEDSD